MPASGKGEGKDDHDDGRERERERDEKEIVKQRCRVKVNYDTYRLCTARRHIRTLVLYENRKLDGCREPQTI